MNGRRLGGWVLASHVLIGLTVILCATVLGALHDLDAQAVVAIFSVAIGLLGGSAAAVGAVGASIGNGTVVSQQTVDHALSSLAEAPPVPHEAHPDG